MRLTINFECAQTRTVIIHKTYYKLIKRYNRLSLRHLARRGFTVHCESLRTRIYMRFFRELVCAFRSFDCGKPGNHDFTEHAPLPRAAAHNRADNQSITPSVKSCHYMVRADRLHASLGDWIHLAKAIAALQSSLCARSIFAIRCGHLCAIVTISSRSDGACASLFCSVTSCVSCSSRCPALTWL